MPTASGKVGPRAGLGVSTKTTYKVPNIEGRLVTERHRVDLFDGSKKVWWTKDGRRGLGGATLVDLPLYGAHTGGDLHKDQLIVLVECEKSRDALASVSIPAVCTVTGASATPGPEALEVVRDRIVCLWSDNHEPGRSHMRRLAGRLDGVACESNDPPTNLDPVPGYGDDNQYDGQTGDDDQDDGGGAGDDQYDDGGQYDDPVDTSDPGTTSDQYDDSLLESGSPRDGAVMTMPGGGCPEEFPNARGGACCR